MKLAVSLAGVFKFVARDCEQKMKHPAHPSVTPTPASRAVKSPPTNFMLAKGQFLPKALIVTPRSHVSITKAELWVIHELHAREVLTYETSEHIL